MAYLSIFYIAIVFMFSFGYRQNQPHALIKLSCYASLSLTFTTANQTRNHATTREEGENLRAAGVTILSIGVSGVPDMMVVKDIR